MGRGLYVWVWCISIAFVWMVYGGWLHTSHLWICSWKPEKESEVLPYHSLPFESGSPIEPRAELVAIKPNYPPEHRPPVLGLQVCLDFYRCFIGVGDSNSNPYTWASNALLTNPIPQPFVFLTMTLSLPTFSISLPNPSDAKIHSQAPVELQYSSQREGGRMLWAERGGVGSVKIMMGKARESWPELMGL